MKDYERLQINYNALKMENQELKEQLANAQNALLKKYTKKNLWNLENVMGWFFFILACIIPVILICQVWIGFNAIMFRLLMTAIILLLSVFFINATIENKG